MKKIVKYGVVFAFGWYFGVVCKMAEDAMFDDDQVRGFTDR
jgi:hypothetical protein